jgi:ABC-type amino acid transport substrate-binding protein
VVDQELPGNPPREAAVSRLTSPGRRSALRLGLGAAASLAGLTLALPVAATPLAKLRERGTLVVGLYNDMPPFHVAGKGIDVELARALADSMQLKLSMLPFHADEDMNDDLRNMVWRGHYLGFGPADVLMHVPVDKPLMDNTPQASIFGPYYRERVAVARNVAALPKLESLADIGKEPVAVPGLSLAGWLMLGADSGAYKDQVRTQFKDGCEAARALLAGEVKVAAGLSSELQSVLAQDSRFVVEPLPSPRAPRNGWAVGMAVKRDSTELAQALQRGVNELSADGRLSKIFAAAGVGWKPV